MNNQAAKKTKTSNVVQPVDCNQCPKTFRHKTQLKIHTDSVHEGIKQPCDSCEYQASSLATLRVHKQAEHEGVTHKCSFCEFVAKFRATLIGHMKRKHTDNL